MSLARLTVVIAAALALTTPRLEAQQAAPQHPDFTGTWRVDHVDTKEDRAASPGGFGGFGGRRGGFGGGFGGRRGGNGGGRRPGGSVGGATDDGARVGQGLSQGDTLRIRQTDTNLILTMGTPDDAEMINYALNGKETTNKLSEDLSVKTKAKWDGRSLVTNSEQEIDTGRGRTSRTVKEVLSLSDPETMTVVSTTESAFGKRTTTATLTKTGD